MDGQDMQDKSEWRLLILGLFFCSINIAKSPNGTYLSHTITISEHKVIPGRDPESIRDV